MSPGSSTAWLDLNSLRGPFDKRKQVCRLSPRQDGGSSATWMISETLYGVLQLFSNSVQFSNLISEHTEEIVVEIVKNSWNCFSMEYIPLQISCTVESGSYSVVRDKSIFSLRLHQHSFCISRYTLYFRILNTFLLIRTTCES